MKKVYMGISAVFVLVVVAAVHIYKVSMGSGIYENKAGYKNVKAGEYEFLVDIKGDKKDIPVILLHGFPESSIMWKKLMKDLTSQGYFCIAPNQRGYSPGAMPLDKSQYKLKFLSDDIIKIADNLSIDKFHLIGHDWGSAVGWTVADKYKKRLLSYTALSVPHIKAFGRAYIEDKKQYEMSEYMRKFQMPFLVEYKLSRDDYSALKSIYSSHSTEEINEYISLFSKKNVLTNILNWYRANFEGFEKGFDIGNISVPTLFLWGNKDIAIGRYGVELTKEYMSGYYRFVELDAGHWLIQEKYDEIYDEIIEHLNKNN